MKWIKCSEQMPENGLLVLCLVDTGMGRIYGDDKLNLMPVVAKHCCSNRWITQNLHGPNIGEFYSLNQTVYFWMPLVDSPIIKY